MSQVDQASTDQENQKCDICEQVFKSKQKLKSHFRSDHYKIAEAFNINTIIPPLISDNKVAAKMKNEKQN